MLAFSLRGRHFLAHAVMILARAPLTLMYALRDGHEIWRRPIPRIYQAAPIYSQMPRGRRRAAPP